MDENVAIEGQDALFCAGVILGHVDVRLAPGNLADTKGNLIVAMGTEIHRGTVRPEGDNAVVDQWIGHRRREAGKASERRKSLGGECLDLYGFDVFLCLAQLIYLASRFAG